MKLQLKDNLSQNTISLLYVIFSIRLLLLSSSNNEICEKLLLI